MAVPFDILKRTPRTNCGQCGLAGCLAFAADVAAAGGNPDRCPYLDKTGLVLGGQRANLEDAARQRDFALAARLQAKIGTLPLARLAPGLGADFVDGALVFDYLGQPVRLDPGRLTIDGQDPDDPRDMILLYNYVACQGGPPPTGEWIGLESLPNSISKVKTLRTYCEEPLARWFSGHGSEEVADACRRLGGMTGPAAGATAGFRIPVLPRVPIFILFWAEDLEDGFAARVKVLFDHRVLTLLDIESLVFTAERLAERLQGLVAK